MSIKVPCRICGKAIEREMNEFAPRDNVCDDCKEGKKSDGDKGKVMSEISKLIMKVYLDLGVRIGGVLSEQIFYAQIPTKYSEESASGWNELVGLEYLEIKTRKPVALALTRKGNEYLNSFKNQPEIEKPIPSQNQSGGLIIHNAENVVFGDVKGSVGQHNLESPKNNEPKWTWIIYVIAAIIAILAYFNIFPPKPVSKDKKISANDIKNSNVSSDVLSRDKIIDQTATSISAGQINIDKQSKIKTSRIKINRIIEDLSLGINGIKKEYFEGNERIANDFSSRNMFSSGVHIKAQMDFAVSTKKKIETLLTKARREIEDVLLKDFGITNLTEMNEFNEEDKRLSELEKNSIPALYKQFEDAVRSREVSSLGTVNITKDFKL